MSRNIRPIRTERTPSPGGFEGIFKPVEHAVLASYLGLPKLLPSSAKSINLDVLPEDHDQEVDGIAPEGAHENALINAVARIALSPIQRELPQWCAFDPDHGSIFARKIRSSPDRGILSRPLFLFRINWACSGPGYDWPEDYHVTWIPHYDRYVVTASSDSRDVHGYEDIAIGSFQGSSVRGRDKKAIRQIITGYWQELSYCAAAWEEFWRSGAIDSETAIKWRDDVWGKGEGYEDCS